MKIWIYTGYFFRSVWLRGLFNTVSFLTSELKYERIFGIKTSNIKPSASKSFYHYQGAGYKILLKIFKEIVAETKNFELVDIGCGKGRALIVGEYCGYNNLKGIELDRELLAEAEHNWKAYALKRNNSVIRLIHANALDINYENKSTVYFLFNPFNEDVLREILNKILFSTEVETWFIYMNPMHRRAFEGAGLLPIKTIKSGRYIEALIYRINPGKY